MKRFCGKWILFASVATLASGAFCAPDAEVDVGLAYYKTAVRQRPSGVYEWTDYVFAHVKVPFTEGKSNRKKVRAQAINEAKNLLRNWAIDLTAEYRKEQVTLPEGIAFAKDVVVKYMPDWAFRGWKLDIDCREYPPDVEEGFYVFGMIFDHSRLVASIPESFKHNPPERDWCAALAHIVPGEMNSGMRDAFFSQCGAWDLVSPAAQESAANESLLEFRAVQKKMTEFLATGELPGEMRRRRIAVKGPNETLDYSTIAQSPEVKTDTKVDVKTNFLSNVSVATNSILRMQTSKEVSTWGRADGGMVKDYVRESDDGIIVVTVTKTIVETTKHVLHKSVHRISGEARFEDVFLGMTNNCVEASQTEIGRAAVAVFTGQTDVAAKERALKDALAENPGDKELWNLYGRCLMVRGEKIGAVICFKQALRLDEKYEFALANLADAYFALGYRRLALGTAVVARGMAKSEWCIKRTESILMAE